MQQNQTNTSYSSAAASLVAVLSDDLSPQTLEQTSVSYASNKITSEQNTNLKAGKEKSQPNAEPIKLKIKTTARALQDTTDFLGQSDEPGIQRGGRITRRTPHQTLEDNAPLYLTSSYDNCPTNSASSSNQLFSNLQQSIDSDAGAIDDHSVHQNQLFETENQFNSDSERGILPKKRRAKNKSKFEANNIDTVLEEPIQKKQRNRRRNEDTSTEISEIVGSKSVEVEPIEEILVEKELEQERIPKKRMTAAARKQYSLPIQQLVEPIPIPELMKASDSVEGSNEAITNNPKGRGRRPRLKVSSPIRKVDAMPQEEKVERPTRTTRHTVNGNIIQVRFEFDIGVFVLSYKIEIKFYSKAGTAAND